jgi:hypothetical protein
MNVAKICISNKDMSTLSTARKGTVFKKCLRVQVAIR